MKQNQRFEDFKVSEIPSSKLAHVWGGAAIPSDGKDNVNVYGGAANGGYSFSFTSDNTTDDGRGNTVTTYTGVKCTDGCDPKGGAGLVTPTPVSQNQAGY